MTIFRRVSVLLVLGSTSVALFACGADASAPAPHETAAATAQPLLEACNGTYTCTKDGAPLADLDLKRDGNIGLCMADDTVFASDHEFTTDAGGHQLLGTWSGDSHAFDICGSGGCVHCVAAGSAAAAGDPGAKGGSCSGQTSCDDFSAGNCGNHEGCSLHGHAVYSFGSFDHYEDECQGSTPSCSSHSTEDECKRQDCTWR